MPCRLERLGGKVVVPYLSSSGGAAQHTYPCHRHLQPPLAHAICTSATAAVILASSIHSSTFSLQRHRQGESTGIVPPGQTGGPGGCTGAEGQQRGAQGESVRRAQPHALLPPAGLLQPQEEPPVHPEHQSRRMQDATCSSQARFMSDDAERQRQEKIQEQSYVGI